jgi:hypothetical protein
VKDGNYDYLSVDNLDAKTIKVTNLKLPGPKSAFPISNGTQLVYLSRLLAPATPMNPAVVDDHVTFTTPKLQIGSNITVDTTSPYSTLLNVPSLGRITLQPGKYHLRAHVLEIGTLADNGVIEAALRNADTGVYFNPTGLLIAGTDRHFLSDEAVVTVTIPTRVDFTFVFAVSLGSYAKAMIDVVQLA